MSNKLAILTTVLFVLCVADDATAQRTPVEEPQADQGVDLERVGPNTRRVSPVGRTPYEFWFRDNEANMPTFEGLVIQDARTEPLEYWEDMGVNGLYIKMADYQITDGWILELPPKGKTKKKRHLFEAGMYFFGGPGHIVIRQEGNRPQRVDFGYRTLYSIPLNVEYQIFNDSDEAIRLVAVTSFPFTLNSFNNEEFVRNNSFAFRDRYNTEEDYMTMSEHTDQNDTVTNLVEDALEFELDSYDHRGMGTTNMHWKMSGNSVIDMHVSEMPGGVYKKAHRHSSDAFILLTSGEGYSLTWPEGRYGDRVRVDWHEGTIFVPPIYWYHQHLNPHPTDSARYLAINAPPIVVNLGLRFNNQLEEDLPEIAAEFKAEVEQRRTAYMQ